MTRLLLLTAVFAIRLAAQDITPRSVLLDPGNHRMWVAVGDLKREYLLHVPEAYDSRGPTPMLLMFHGSGGSLDEIARATGWIGQSETEKFLAVYPNGFPNEDGMRVWNDGRRGSDQVDDVAFVRAMISDVSSRLRVDQKRIFVVGFSNGAGLAYRLATEMNDRIAGIAPVAGRINVAVEKLDRPVPTLAIVGTKDPGFESDTRAAERWAGIVGCSAPRDTARNGRYSSVSYQKCPGKSEVVSYTVKDWEHYWPGGQNPGVEMWAETTIWKFFQKHPLSTPK